MALERKPTVSAVKRKITLSIGVNDAQELPKLGRHLNAFFREVDDNHGTFDIDIELIVNWPESLARGASGPIPFMVFATGGNGGGGDLGEPIEED